VALNAVAALWTRIQVTNINANPADLGPSNVAAANSYSLPANATVSPQLGPGDVLDAVRSGAADAVLSVLCT
jgi:hypothetical protein